MPTPSSAGALRVGVIGTGAMGRDHVATLERSVPRARVSVVHDRATELAEKVAGPFKDVFTVMDPDRMNISNYGLAGAVYFLASVLVNKLPTGGAKRA